MEAIGVSFNTITVAKYRKSKSYVFEDDPEDKRRILVEYDSLKPVLKDKAHEWLGECPHDYYRKFWIKSYITPDASAKRFFKTYVLCDKGLTPQEQIDYYTAIQWLNMIIKIKSKKSLLKSNNCTISQFWETVCLLIKVEGIRLPASYPRLTQKIKDYTTYGYRVVIKEGNFFSDNAAVIKDDVADWITAKFSLPIKHSIPYIHKIYNEEAIVRGWKEIKHEDSIRKFLYHPEVKQKWYGPRHGEKKADQKYGRMHATSMPTRRDSLWESDGTKLNFFDSTGKLRASWTVYEVMDVFSEKFLGCHFSKTEDHIAQYHAYKMAFQVAGYKPHEIKTDNQGGHKKIGNFLSKLAHIHIRTMPYNGSSKAIENAMGRLQQQVMRNEYWFFTGQNITSKKLDSKANMEFIIDNLKDLPTEDEIKEAYLNCRTIWNNMKHPKYKKSRNELYLNSQNTETEKVDELDMVELFWLETKAKFTNNGIIVEIKGTKYHYEPLDQNGMPDFDFRRKYIDQTFVVKYDPENLLCIRLYLKSNTGLRFITVAEPYLKTPRAQQDHTPESRRMFSDLLQFEKSEMDWLRKQNHDREERTGVKASDLIKKPISLGQYQKQLSNQDWEDEFDKPLSMVSGRSSKKESALNRI